MINEFLDELKQSGKRGIQITAECEEILALGYADDIIEGSDSVISLQSLINLTSGFCLRKKMEVNLSKTNIVVFRNGGF